MIRLTAQPVVRRRRWRFAPRAHVVALTPALTVRRRAPAAFSSHGFGRPLLMRQLFQDVPGPLPDVVSMLDAPTVQDARAVADRLLGQGWSEEEGRALRAIAAMALGDEPLPGLWSDDAAADALRLRLLRSGAARATTWGLFFKWAGARLENTSLARLPPRLAAVAVASLVSQRGYRGAFQLLTQRAPSRLQGGFAPPLALVALRCALDGVFLPDLVTFLLPPPRRARLAATGREPWAAGLLALHAYRMQGNVAGLVHLSAALLATDLRERVLLFAERDTAAWLRRRWWSSAPPETARHTSTALLLLRSKMHLVTAFSLTPWPRHWGGPAFAAIVPSIERLLGRRAVWALPLLLDDRLAVAALFAAVGYLPSAEALLAQADVPPAQAEARDALAEGLARAPAHAVPATVLKEMPWGPEAERVFQRLSSTPEPSVELASPHWMLGDTRGAVMSRLVAEGRSATARAVRPVLDRADLRRDLEPYWILRGTEDDTAAVSGLAAWLDGKERSAPSEPEWMRFAEDACRRLQRDR